MKVLCLGALCLGKENTKTGKVRSFSLPSFVSCPVTTPWCRQHCYARRYERLRRHCRDGYARNLALALDTGRFVAVMLEALPARLPCFRLHVSGDFFSASYALAWSDICARRPRTLFWGYTRAWLAPGMTPALDRLRSLSNVQLFASLDAGMPLPPAGWRVTFIEDDPRAKGVPCKHQHGEADSCRACQYCFTTQTGNVIFKRH